MFYTLQVKRDGEIYTLAHSHNRKALYNHMSNIYHKWIVSSTTAFSIFGYEDDDPRLFDDENEAQVIMVTDSPRICNYYLYNPEKRCLVETTYDKFYKEV